MKKRNTLLTLLCLVSLSLIVSCATTSKEKVITLEMSDQAKIYEQTVLLESGDKEYFAEGIIEQLVDSLSDRPEQVLPECKVSHEIGHEVFEGYNVYTLTDDDYENIILYIHGGAWILEISDAHVTFCDQLASRLNAKVYIPLYPLAPESTAEDTYAFLEALYKEISEENKKVYVMGDSAGGQLTLALMYAIKTQGLKKPAKLVVMAPCSDMSFSNPDILEIEKTDPELAVYGCKVCAELWAGSNNCKDPKNSAVYADVKGYPATMIIQGTNDILSCDNYILYKNMINAGVDATLVKGEGFWHVFGVYSIPEKETVLNLISDFCKN